MEGNMCPKRFSKLTIILILILVSTSLVAQVNSEKADHGVNINFFNGYAVSYKYNTNQDLNYRIYLSLGSSWSDSKNDSKNTSSNGQSRTGEDNDNGTYFTTNLSYQFLFNIISQKTFNFYIGVGPNLNYRYENWESNNNEKYDSYDYFSEYSRKSKTFGVGLISLIGIEAYLTKNITLFAETHLVGSRNWSSTERKDKSFNSNYDDNIYSSESSSDGTSWSANLQLVKVGLGIYF